MQFSFCMPCAKCWHNAGNTPHPLLHGCRVEWPAHTRPILGNDLMTEARAGLAAKHCLSTTTKPLMCYYRKATGHQFLKVWTGSLPNPALKQGASIWFHLEHVWCSNFLRVRQGWFVGSIAGYRKGRKALFHLKWWNDEHLQMSQCTITFLPLNCKQFFSQF